MDLIKRNFVFYFDLVKSPSSISQSQRHLHSEEERCCIVVVGSIHYLSISNQHTAACSTAALQCENMCKYEYLLSLLTVDSNYLFSLLFVFLLPTDPDPGDTWPQIVGGGGTFTPSTPHQGSHQNSSLSNMKCVLCCGPARQNIRIF